MKDDFIIKKIISAFRSGTLIKGVKDYFSYGETVVRMQIDLIDLPSVKNIENYVVREIDISNEKDVNDWLNIINDGYDEDDYDLNDAIKHFHHHLFLNILATYFIMDEEKPIATISIGQYKSDKDVGGDARISVIKEYQGKGLGKYIILYGYNKLKEKGIIVGETMISIKRKPSIFAHFSCGFVPFTDLSKCQYKDNAFFIYRIWANYNLKKMYKEHRLKQDIK